MLTFHTSIPWLLKTAFQQDRSERKPEPYCSKYVEDLSEARTQLEAVFSGLIWQTCRHADTDRSPSPSSGLRQWLKRLTKRGAHRFPLLFPNKPSRLQRTAGISQTKSPFQPHNALGWRDSSHGFQESLIRGRLIVSRRGAREIIRSINHVLPTFMLATGFRGTCRAAPASNFLQSPAAD